MRLNFEVMKVRELQCGMQTTTEYKSASYELLHCHIAYLVSQDEEDPEILQHGTLGYHFQMKNAAHR